MKNTKIIATSIALGFLALMAFGNVVSANSIKIGLGVSGEVKGELKDHVGINAGVNANTNVSHDRDDDRGDKKDDDSDHKDKSLPKGIEKKIDDLRDIPKDKWPSWLGWFRHWFDKSTSTVEVVRPIIRKLEVTASTTSATISWATSASTTGEIKFGTSKDLGASTTVVADASVSTIHSLTLSGLSADTNYYFIVSVKDVDGNVKTSEVRKFHTKAELAVDVTAPTIFFSTGVETSSTTAHVLWVTSERADSKVWISSSSTPDVSTGATLTSSSMLYVHDMVVTGLTANTTYYFAVKSTDEKGNVSAVSTGSFVTR